MHKHRRKTPRILFVLKWREQPYGDEHSWGDRAGDKPLSSGLFNSANFMAEMLAAEDIPTRLVHVADGNAIHREIVAFGATHVIVEAFWCPPYKFDDLHAACPDVEFIVRNHSETPFLANEGIAFEWSLAYLNKPNVRLAPNAPRMLADMRFLAAQAHPDWSEAEVERRVPFLPNYYPTDVPRHPRKGDDGYVDVGCFGAIRPLKNPVTQAIAAMMFARLIGRRLNFHINGQRVENGGSPVLKNLFALFEGREDAQIMSHSWLPHDGFQALVARMDLVTQVTFTETFNIVCADAVSQGVPIVTSEEVPWADAGSRADPNDARSIAAVMCQAWETRHCGNPNLNNLRRYSQGSRARWLRLFA